MQTVRRWIHLSIVALLMGLLGLVGPALAGHTVGVTDDSITIGSFGALTGPYYLFGKLIMNGAEAVYHEVNKQGGIHGRRLVFIREDDRCDAATAIAAAKKLIYQHEVFMIHGGGCSNPAIAAREEIERANVPWVVFAAVADPITMPVAPYIWSTALTASTESRAQVDFAKVRGAKRLAIIAQHDAWGNARYKPLMEKLKQEGIAPVADEEIGVDANDATTQVLRIRQANADAVLLIVYPKATAVFMRDAHKVGYKPIYVGQTALSDLPALQQQVGIAGALDNFFSISQVGFAPEDSRMGRWRALGEELFPGDRLSVYNLFGIASAQVVVDEEIIDTLGVDRKTIYRVRKNYHEHGMEKALQEKGRSGAPSKVDGQLEATLTMLACSTPPEGSARWTLRLLTYKLLELKAIEAISIETVRTMLKKMNLNLGSSSAGA